MLPKFKAVVIPVVLALLLASEFCPVAEAAWFGVSGWKYRKKITIDSGKIPDTDATDLTDFPVLINTTDLDWRHTAQGGRVGNADGTDILFTLSDGSTKLSHEIEKYDPNTGALVAWVKIPTLVDNVDTDIYIYYGNTGAADQQNVLDVWSNNYRAVWHLKENPAVAGVNGIRDSTVNANHGTDNGGMDANDQVAGPGGTALEFDGDDDFIELGAIVSEHPLRLNGSDVTISAWIYHQNAGDDWERVVDKSDGGNGTNGYAFFVHPNDRNVWITVNTQRYTSSNSIYNFNEWTHITGVITATDYFIYVNGTEDLGAAFQGVDGPVQPTDTSTNMRLGSWNHSTAREYKGCIDEVHISNEARPADWILTEFNNQNSPETFYSVGTEQPEVTAWYDNNWLYRKKITIDSSKVSTVNGANLSAFPLLILRTDADWKHSAQLGGHVGKLDGTDFLFTASDGITKFPHENENYDDVAGELITWVSVPTLSASENTEIYAYYGNAGAADQQNINAVWDAGYMMVQHLDESPANGIAGHFDSTLNNNTGTPQNFNGNPASTTAATGKISGADIFDGSNDFVDYNNGGTLQGVDDLTIEIWFNQTAEGGSYDPFIQRGGNDTGAFSVTVRNSTDELWIFRNGGSVYYQTGITIPKTQWNHLVVVKYANDDLKIYLNAGVPAATNGFDITVPANLSIRNNGWMPWGHHFNGIIDEVRVSNVARNADWIDTSYNNQNNPSTFSSAGPEEVNSRGTTVKGG
ncbi:DUF2341 domain-containing protein [Planctomycetota bacterium]